MFNRCVWSLSSGGGGGGGAWGGVPGAGGSGIVTIAFPV